MTATLRDLELEQWLRARERGEIKWTTKDGRDIPIIEMSDSHLENAINHIYKKDEFESIAVECERFGDGD